MNDPALAVRLHPIVRLPDRTPVGFEAIARLGDGRSPTLAFAAAAAAGPEALEALELAALEAVASAATRRPAGTFVSVNLSASTLLRAANQIETMLEAIEGPLVLELVEWNCDEAVVPVIAALRARLGRRLRLALDDLPPARAARGLELFRPEIVKTDPALLWAAIEDAAPLALLRHLVAMAHQAGALCVIEGIEDAICETIALVSRAELGQGYLYPELDVSEPTRCSSAEATTKAIGRASRPESGRIRAR